MMSSSERQKEKRFGQLQTPDMTACALDWGKAIQMSDLRSALLLFLGFSISRKLTTDGLLWQQVVSAKKLLQFYFWPIRYIYQHMSVYNYIMML